MSISEEEEEKYPNDSPSLLDDVDGANDTTVPVCNIVTFFVSSVLISCVLFHYKY